MINEIHVRGIGGIKKADIALTGSFIVITGESGAGKSSLVRAVEFITGKRAQANLIHASENSSDVTLMLTTKNNDTVPFLSKVLLKDGNLTVNRVFNRNGRGHCTVQNLTISINQLSAFMEKEVMIQSQFAQLELLEPVKQLELVDSCGGEELKTVKAELASTFNTAIETERNIIALKKKREETTVKFQDAESYIRQINSLQLENNTEILLEKELNELDSNSARIGTMCSVYAKMSGGAVGGGILEELESICKQVYAFENNSDTLKHQIAEKMLSSAQELTSMLQADTQTIINEGSVEEARESLEKKLGTIRKLKRTLKLENCEALITYAKNAKGALLWLKESRDELMQLETAAEQLKKSVSSIVQMLRKLRKAAAISLADKVNANLHDLAMEYAKFEIAVEEHNKVRAYGAESVNFMLKLPEQEPMPVSKTASGGELSRILLALQLSLGTDQLPGTIVFDEVEAGLGGRTALLAGYKLRDLSKNCRTILITHEATIAAMADQHFLVQRNAEETAIVEVKGKSREREIARMLSGDSSSKEALEHAHALLDGN